MSDSIKTGDLVIVVKPKSCCGYSDSIGRILAVQKDSNRYPSKTCTRCGHVSSNLIGESVNIGLNYGGDYINISRLKKIPPLSDDESTDTSADIDKTKEAV